MPCALAPPATIVQHKPKPLDDRHFYMRMCRDPMATDKLAEGIRNFVKDTVKLENMIKPRLGLSRL